MTNRRQFILKLSVAGAGLSLTHAVVAKDALPMVVESSDQAKGLGYFEVANMQQGSNAITALCMSAKRLIRRVDVHCSLTNRSRLKHGVVLGLRRLN
jgi:hypothetical protein